jgi:tetratricopeptide (TPR) repeat protein
MSVLAGLVFAMAAWGQDPAELLELGRPAEAERALAAELRARPDDVRSLVLMGVALDQQQRFADAEPYYRRALKLAPGAAVLNNAGNHYLAAGKPDEARRMFERAVRLEPHHANANLQLARLAAASKSGPEVLRCLDRLDPAGQGTAAARLLRARALAWTGHTDAASRLLNSLEAESKGGAPMDFSLGLAYADAKLYENAEAAFSRALAAAPSDRDILYNLGLAAIGARHYARAAQVLELALRQAPADVDAL